MKNIILIIFLIITTQSFSKENKNIGKKSKSGICHDKSSRWYKKTKNYIAFKSIKECLKSGGRLPKK